MKTAGIGKEAVVQVPNRMGAMAQVAKILSDKGIDIKAAIATVDGSNAVIRLVTGDHLRTMDALRENALNPLEARVVMIEAANRPGVLRHVTERLVSENIDLNYLYATATAGADKSLVIFASTNNDRAVVVLNE
jgi:hypothetical protein